MLPHHLDHKETQDFLAVFQLKITERDAISIKRNLERGDNKEVMECVAEIVCRDDISTDLVWDQQGILKRMGTRA